MMSLEINKALAQLRAKYPATDDPVLSAVATALEEGHWITRNGAVERLLIDRGKSFRGIPRPPGCRTRSASVFSSAYACAIGASDFAASYVEGLSMHRAQRKVRHHAWLTTDGSDAIEIAWSAEATEFDYFGIMFPNLIFSAQRPWNFRGLLRTHGYWRELLLEDLDDLEVLSPRSVPER